MLHGCSFVPLVPFNNLGFLLAAAEAKSRLDTTLRAVQCALDLATLVCLFCFCLCLCFLALSHSHAADLQSGKAAEQAPPVSIAVAVAAGTAFALHLGMRLLLFLMLGCRVAVMLVVVVLNPCLECVMICVLSAPKRVGFPFSP